MGHKYNKRDGAWSMHYPYCDTTTVVRTCPICGFMQPLDVMALHIVDFSHCPKCKAKLDVPKKLGTVNQYKIKG